MVEIYCAIMIMTFLLYVAFVFIQKLHEDEDE
jgi:hypothetical protein